jgi:hypothetical protein
MSNRIKSGLLEPLPASKSVLIRHAFSRGFDFQVGHYRWVDEDNTDIYLVLWDLLGASDLMML